MILITTENCTKCEEIKEFIKTNNILINTPEIESSVYNEVVNKYRIMSAPVVVLEDKWELVYWDNIKELLLK